MQGKAGRKFVAIAVCFLYNDTESKLLEINCNNVDFGEDFLNSYLRLLVLMYADDTIIVCDSEEGMQQALTVLNLYCKQWKLQLNCNKTKIVMFSRGRVNTDNYKFEFGGENIEVVEDYKYLGVLFNYKGRFRKDELELKEHATRAIYSLIGKCRKFDLPADMQTELFNTTVLPVLTYASEIWGFYRVRELESLHMKFLKQALGVHKNTGNDMVYGELGVFPLDIHIKSSFKG